MSPANPWRHPPGVPRVEEPRAEGRFYLPGGRRLGYAEFGDPAGAVVLWFHGTPGGRRQFPLVGRRAAEKLGLRVVMVERPGSGLSDAYAYPQVLDWARDMAHVADALGAERMGVVGLSGGGPYALACAASSLSGGRVAAVAVLGGVTPSVGPEAATSGAIELARTLASALTLLRQPLAVGAAAVLLPILPFGHLVYRGFSALMPAGDRRVFADPDIEGMFIDDIVLAAKGRFQAMVDDARLFGRDWGFRLADVNVPVRWWHGDADPIVTFDDAKAAVSHLPNAELVLMPDESHLGGFSSADEVLGFLRSHL
ncbi:MAG: alpha/beta hydrolase [Mycobacteriaceae bacterium]|nr:alpha/beta hydrolase [Mycobacteriaceae bacterium]